MINLKKRHFDFKKQKVVTLQIWDTAGDHKLRDLVSLYYRNSHAALLVFDITQDQTRDSLQDWLIELEDRCDLNNVIIKVAANKFDLVESKIKYFFKSI